MATAHTATPGIDVLTTQIPVPGLGTVPVNAFLLHNDEPLLDGPAGVTFCRDVEAERVEIDALDLTRTLSGRLPGTAVLTNPLPN